MSEAKGEENVKVIKDGDTEITIMENQPCPFCNENTLELSEHEREIPYCGNAIIFSMTCHSCKYHKGDIELEKAEAVKYTFDIDSEEDMKVRVVKSAGATVKLPRIMTWESTETAQGFITNVEGILRRAKHAIETARDNSEDKDEKKKAKNLLKKIQKVMWGQDKLKLIIEDPTGNSAIISERAVKSGKPKK